MLLVQENYLVLALMELESAENENSICGRQSLMIFKHPELCLVIMK